MKVTQTIGLMICAGLLALGQSSSQALAVQSPKPFPGDNRLRQQERLNQPASETEWQEVSQWMQEHCPNRLAFVETRLQNKPIEQEKAKKLMIEKYRQLKNIKNDLPLQNAMVMQAEAADAVFGAQLDYRDAVQHRDPQARSTAERQLKRAAAGLVDAEIAVREARLVRLQAELNDLKKRKEKLAGDAFNRELNIAKNPTSSPPAKATGDAISDQIESPPPPQRGK